MSSNIQLLPDSLSSELESFTAVDGFLDRNQPIVTKVPMLVESHAELKSRLISIPAETIRRNALKTSRKNVKVINRKTMAHSTFIILKALRITGKKKKIDEIKNLPLYTEKNLARMRFIQLGEYSTGLSDLLVKYKIELSALNITDLEINAFNSGVESYKSTLKQTDIKTGLSESSTEQIMKQFLETEDIMDDISDIIDTMMDKEPVFYSEFKQISQIRIYGTRHKKKEPESENPPANENPPIKENAPDENNRPGNPQPQ